MDKISLDQMLKQMDSSARLESDVRDVLTEFVDDYLNELLKKSCELAKGASNESAQSNQISTQQEGATVKLEKLTSLTCHERIDCSSREVFNESLPGAWDMKKEFLSLRTMEKASSRFRTELDPEDVKLVNELGQLSADKLMEYVRNLQASSFSLAEEEARQFTRARCLNVFGKNSTEKQQ